MAKKKLIFSYLVMGVQMNGKKIFTRKRRENEGVHKTARPRRVMNMPMEIPKSIQKYKNRVVVCIPHWKYYLTLDMEEIHEVLTNELGLDPKETIIFSFKKRKENYYLMSHARRLGYSTLMVWHFNEIKNANINYRVEMLPFDEEFKQCSYCEKTDATYIQIRLEKQRCEIRHTAKIVQT